MEKIISEEKRERIERNKAMVSDFNEAMRKGSDKTAVYKHLAQKYNLKRASSVYTIIKNYKKKSKTK